MYVIWTDCLIDNVCLAIAYQSRHECGKESPSKDDAEKQTDVEPARHTVENINLTRNKWLTREPTPE